MPIYTYTCSKCGKCSWQNRGSHTKDDLRRCPKCQDGSLFRSSDAIPNISGSAFNRPDVSISPLVHRSGPTVKNVTIMNFPKGTGIKLDGNINALVENYSAINTKFAFAATRGARVEATNVVHKAPPSNKRKKRKQK